jgi:hypothetical protein
MEDEQELIDIVEVPVFVSIVASALSHTHTNVRLCIEGLARDEDSSFRRRITQRSIATSAVALQLKSALVVLLFQRTKNKLWFKKGLGLT